MAGVESWLLTFLVNAAWQVPLLAVVAAGLGGLLRRAQARSVFGLWLGALVLTVGLPATSSWWVLARSPAVPPAGAGLAESPGASATPPIAGSLLTDTDRPSSAVRQALAATVIGSRGRWLLGAWTLSCLLSATGLVRAAVRASRLRAAAWPLPADDTAHRLAGLLRARSDGATAGAVGTPHRAQVELLATDAPVGPLTLGLWRQAILLPRPWLEAADPAQLEGVLAHELAHLERRDLWLHLAARLLLIPLAFHPAAHWIGRRLAAARELACDELAAAGIGRVEYARALVSAAGNIAGFTRPVTALGVFDAELLEVRMRRLTEDAPRWNARRSFAALALAAGVLGLAAAAAGAGALGMPAAGAASTGTERFAGIWRGLFDQGAGRGLPGATLTIAILDGQPRAALLMNRHVKNADGTTSSTATGLPVVDQRIQGDRLTLVTREDGFRFHGGPPASVDIQWRFTLTGDGSGELAVLANSYFAPAKARGESVPPPPPPMAMRREALASQGGLVQK